MVRVEIQDVCFCFINVYAPNQGSDRSDIFKKIKDLLKHCDPQVRQHTWVKVSDGNVSAARLDRVYMSQSFSNRLLNSYFLPSMFH